MKRLGGLWEQVISFENLLLAYRKARKGKASRKEVVWFGLELEKELLSIRDKLESQTWRPRKYRIFTIYERKPRQISAAPFRDRVVHHALMNLLEPLLDKRFIYDTHACRAGHGVHLAVSRYQAWAQTRAYALKLDISRYFPSIDQAILKLQLVARIKDKKVLWLLDQIIEHAPAFPNEHLTYYVGDDLLTPLERSRGLPIGNLTSQFLANLYLDDFDHFVKEGLKVKCYLRYVDDMILLSRDKQQLHDWKSAIDEKLAEIRLTIHPRKANIFQTALGVDVLGYQVFPGYKKLRNDNGYRFVRRLNGFAEGYRKGCLDWDDFNPSVKSWIGHAQQADTFNLRQSIFDSTVFRRGESKV